MSLELESHRSKSPNKQNDDTYSGFTTQSVDIIHLSGNDDLTPPLQMTLSLMINTPINAS